MDLTLFEALNLDLLVYPVSLWKPRGLSVELGHKDRASLWGLGRINQQLVCKTLSRQMLSIISI